MNIVFNLNFHFVSMFFASLIFFKCMFVKSLFSTTLFVCCQIYFDNFYFLSCTMFIVSLKEVQLVIAMDDLDFKIKDVVFEAKVFNRYDTLDWLANRIMEDSSYAYLHCDLFNFLALNQSPKVYLRKVTCMWSSQLSWWPLCHQSILNMNWFPMFFH